MVASESAEQYKAQLNQLQEYVQNSSTIRELYDTHRIASNQIEIMQDLRMENVNLALKVNQVEALQKQLGLSESQNQELVSKLGEAYQDSTEKEGQIAKM